jgi:hypothetical protein
MIAILLFALCCSGIALILGFRDSARGITDAVLAIIIGAVALNCFRCWLADVWESAGLTPDIGWFWPLAAILLAATGGIAWKMRALRQRRFEDHRRRHMHPRRPAPPSAPNVSADDDGGFS